MAFIQQLCIDTWTAIPRPIHVMIVMVLVLLVLCWIGVMSKPAYRSGGCGEAGQRMGEFAKQLYDHHENDPRLVSASIAYLQCARMILNDDEIQDHTGMDAVATAAQLKKLSEELA